MRFGPLTANTFNGLKLTSHLTDRREAIADLKKQAEELKTCIRRIR